MIITPRVHTIGSRYKPLVLKQDNINGVLYFRSLEPAYKIRGSEVTYEDENRAINAAHNAVNKINVIV